MSKIFIPLRGLLEFFNLKFLTILSLIYFSLKGLNLCNGLNLPFGSHHSDAISENFSISLLFAVS